MIRCGREGLRHAHRSRQLSEAGLRPRFSRSAPRAPIRRVGISENIPAADQIADDTPLVLTFERISGLRQLELRQQVRIRCSPEVWREFNGDLEIRSAMIVALRDGSRYSGSAAFAWSEPRKIELREIELVRTLVAVLELIPAGAAS